MDAYLVQAVVHYCDEILTHVHSYILVNMCCVLSPAANFSYRNVRKDFMIPVRRGEFRISLLSKVEPSVSVTVSIGTRKDTKL